MGRCYALDPDDIIQDGRKRVREPYGLCQLAAAPV